MIINWQEIFYISSSLGMAMIFIVGVLFLWILIKLLQVLQNVGKTMKKGEKIIEDVRYFRQDFKIGILKFLVRILEKGDK